MARMRDRHFATWLLDERARTGKRHPQPRAGRREDGAPVARRGVSPRPQAAASGAARVTRGHA
eukprot:4888688-Pyramimonas_sp.AAC.1